MALNDDIFLSTLKQYYGFDSFRSIQLDIIRSIASGHDTIGLMPTGGGKSITFQVPALTMEGVCIVITPLISLMKDQVEHLKAIGIKAEAIHSGLSHYDIQRILDNAIYGAVKFLYISPERLSNQLFVAKLFYMKVCFITVDEAHCISQWGYDFRPSYLNIKSIRDQKPNIPILALTATATPKVLADIKECLFYNDSFKNEPNVFCMSFRRKNLSYVVRTTMNKDEEMIHILKSVKGSAIVYTRNREKTREISAMLEKEGISSTFYHAGLNIAVKDFRQDQWQKGLTRVIVATNAFGMGIDKPDVRLVIHADVPDSLEAYFQEAGRAGRDGKLSYAVLLYEKSDRVNLEKRCNESFPPKDYIKLVYDHLAYFFQLAVESGEGAKYEFNEEQFCYRFKHYPTQLEHALHILENAGYIHYDNDPDGRSRVCFRMHRDELYSLTNLSSREETVLSTLLRYYGSLFSELTYIDITFLSIKAGMSEEHFRVALKELSHKGVIAYVPPRKTATITYLKQRIDSKRLIFDKKIYEFLKERKLARINAVLQYIDTDDRCRQRMLSEYFGEKTKEKCGHCDVCLSENKSKRKVNMEHVMKLLSDHKQHLITELKDLELPKEQLHEMIENLRDNDDIIFYGPYIMLNED